MVFKSPFPDLKIPQCNILSYLFEGDRATSETPLWIDAERPSSSLSRAQMLQMVKQFAVGLDKLGVSKGKAVMVYTPNHLYVPVAYLAAAGSGRCFTGANPNYTTDEVAFQMKRVDAAILLVHPSLLNNAIKAAKEAGLSKSMIFLFSGQDESAQQGVKDWRTFLARKAEAKKWQWDPLKGEEAAETVAAINFSSGTTGLPKGACVTHYNLVANASQVVYNKFAGTGEDENNFTPERWIAFLPLYHAYSQLWTINIAARLGIEAFIMEKFVFEAFLKNISQHKITALQAVPPVLVMLAKRPETEKFDVTCLKNIMSGAAPLSNEIQTEVMRKYNLEVCQGWGMSETTCGGIMSPGHKSDLTGSIGVLLPNTEARLVNDDDKEVTQEGEPGELHVRGPQILLEYLKNPEATKDSKTADGWFKTGDVAVTKDGKWWIVDRKKELIKVNGMQVAPAELEAVLLECNDVADAAVTGITLDAEEYPIAYVVLQDSAKGKVKVETIQDFVADKVAKHKRLTGGVKFVDEVPKLPSGKIVRKLLREWAKRDAKEMEKNPRARL